MSKTVAISEDTHLLIVKKQTEIFEKYRVSVRISDLANTILRKFIDRAEEVLGLRGEDESQLSVVDNVETRKNGSERGVSQREMVDDLLEAKT